MSLSFFSQRGSRRSLVSAVKVVGVALLVVGLMVALAGCGKAGLAGKWQSPDGEIVEFTSDGKMIADGSEGLEITYKIDGDKLVIGAMGMEIPVDYSLDGDTLKVQDLDSGEMMTMTRVK